MPRFLLTTDENLEDVTAQEWREGAEAGEICLRPYDVAGQLRVTADDARRLLKLRTVHHVIEIRHEDVADDLDGVRRVLAGVEFPELESNTSFRVSSDRVRAREFDRRQLQGAAGGVLQQRYGTVVDLEGFEVNVRVNLHGRHLVAGIQLTRDSLGNRIRRTRSLRTSIKPTLAVAMLRLVGAHRGPGRLLDPMCGSGTIPIEARQLNPQLEVFASDWDEATCEVARGTIANHGLDIEVHTADARQVGAIYGQPFDYIVTDPPYGVRQGRRTDLTQLYEGLLASFDQILAPGGKLALVVLKLHSLLRALRGSRLTVVHERLTEAGGLHPRIYVLERPATG